MTQPLMLEGVLKETQEADEGLLRKFRKEKQQLEDDLRDARQELDDLRADKERLDRSIRNLQQQLSPLHRALRALFGEIELAVGEDTAVPMSVPAMPGAAQPAIDPRWQSWKEKLPGRPAEMIDALLLHRDMSTRQLATALHCGKDAIYQAAHKLSQVGLISNVGGRYSLKPL